MSDIIDNGPHESESTMSAQGHATTDLDHKPSDSNSSVTFKSLLDDGKTSASTDKKADWYYSKDIPGKGEKPEWFIHSKYQSVEEQAKAYKELQKRTANFEGAPDKYEFKLMDDLKDKVDLQSEDAMLNKFQEMAKATNMSNDTYNQLANWYLSQRAAEVAQENELDAKFMQEEMQALGPDAKEKIETAKTWMQRHVPNKFDPLMQAICQTALGVEFVHHLTSTTKYAPVPVGGEVARFETNEKLKNLMADPRYGKDPEFDKYVEAQYARSLAPETL